MAWKAKICSFLAIKVRGESAEGLQARVPPSAAFDSRQKQGAAISQLEPGSEIRLIAERTARLALDVQALGAVRSDVGADSRPLCYRHYAFPG